MISDTVGFLGMDLYPGFCDPLEAAALLDWARSLNYERAAYGPRLRESGRVLSRGYRQFGVAYASSGARLPAADPVPDILVPVIARAQAASGHRFDASYCVVMHYPPGTGIGWHVDGKRFRDVLLVVSLGGSAGVEFRTVGGNATSSKWDLGHGSLYAMYGTARWEYEHRVLPVTEERFCLQFRDVDSAAGMAQPAGEA